MSSVQELPEALSEYDSLISMSTDTLDAFPGAVYLCDCEGWVVKYNTEAARLWGRVPVLGRMEIASAGPISSSCPMERRSLLTNARWQRR